MVLDKKLAQTRFRTTLELFEAGEAMMRLNIARENPELSPEEVEQRLVAWLRHRPGAEHGDCAPGPLREFR